MASSSIIPFLGDAVSLSSDQHAAQMADQGRRWYFQSPKVVSGMPNRPAQPPFDLPRSAQVANRLPVFNPQAGNNLMLQFRPGGGSPYGRQDPVQEATLKLAEMGVKAARVKAKRSQPSIFRVSKSHASK